MVLAVTIAISTVNPLLLEYAIDVNIAQKDWRGLVALCVFMVVINLVYAAGVRLRMLLMARITNNILLEIRDELYTHIQTLSFSFSIPAGRKDSGAHHRRCQLVKGCAERRCHKADSEHSHDHRHSGDHDDQKHLALLKCDSRAAADRYRHVFYSDRRTQEMADVPEKSSNVTAYIHEDFSGIRIIKSFTAEQESQGEFDRLLLEHQNSFIHAVRLADGFPL